MWFFSHSALCLKSDTVTSPVLLGWAGLIISPASFFGPGRKGCVEAQVLEGACGHAGEACEFRRESLWVGVRLPLCLRSGHSGCTSCERGRRCAAFPGATQWSQAPLCQDPANKTVREVHANLALPGPLSHVGGRAASSSQALCFLECNPDDVCWLLPALWPLAIVHSLGPVVSQMHLMTP